MNTKNSTNNNFQIEDEEVYYAFEKVTFKTNYFSPFYYYTDSINIVTFEKKYILKSSIYYGGDDAA